MALQDSTFLLITQTPDAPNARVLTADPFVSNLQFTDSGVGGFYELKPTLNLKALAETTTPGLVTYLGSNTFASRSITTDGSVTITNPSGVLGNINLAVASNTTTQRVEVQADGVLTGANKTLNFVSGNNMTINASDAGSSIDIIFSSSGGGGGGGSVTSVGLTSPDLVVSNSPITTSGNIAIAFPTDDAVVGKVWTVLSDSLPAPTYGWSNVSGGLIQNASGLSGGSTALLPITPSSGTSIYLGLDLGNSGSTGGGQNMLFGQSIMTGMTTATDCVVVGAAALQNGTTVTRTTALGNFALNSLQSSGKVVSIGYYSGYAATSASNCTFIGDSAGVACVNADSSTFIGSGCANLVTQDIRSTAVGFSAFPIHVTGSNNTALGAFAGPKNDGLTNTTCLGINAQTKISNSVILGSACKVGIGTDSPAYGLHMGSLSSDYTPTIYLENLPSSPTPPGTTGAVLYSSNSGQLLIESSNTLYNGRVVAVSRLSNPSIGRATLVAGGATVLTNKAVSNNTLIYLSRSGNSTSYGELYTTNIIPNASFDIVSTSATDDGQVNWVILDDGI